MFTYATRNFGVWKANHPSKKAFHGSPTSGLLMAFAACALVSWLVFFLLLKIRGEFFLIETSSIQLSAPSFSDKSEMFHFARPAAIIVGAVADSENTLKIVFDSGESFHFPSQESAMINYLQGRTEAIELSTMLAKSPLKSVARMQIWPDKSVSFLQLQQIVSVFSKFGFDDFDVAVARQ